MSSKDYQWPGMDGDTLLQLLVPVPGIPGYMGRREIVARMSQMPSSAGYPCMGSLA